MTNPKTLPIDGICVRPDVAKFERGEEGKLAEYLEASAAATGLAEVYTWEDLRLDRRGYLPNGYRFGTAAFKSLCKMLAPGLFAAVADLAGWGVKGPAPVDEYSLSDAVAIYNSVMQRRFDARLLGNVRLVEDAAGRLYDGVCGNKFVLLENRDFHEQVREAVAGSGRPMVLHQATVVGRRLTLRYLDRKAAAGLPGANYLHTGIYFVNNELGGEQVDARFLLSDLDGYALGESMRSVRHTGRGFEARLSSLLEEAFRPALTPDRLRELVRAASRPAEPAPGPDNPEARREALAKRLAKRGVPIEIGRRVVAAAESANAPRNPNLLRRPPGRPISTLDLYLALMHLAKSRHASLRERLEHFAFTLLIDPNFAESEST